jgi:hypothetical protein
VSTCGLLQAIDSLLRLGLVLSDDETQLALMSVVTALAEVPGAKTRVMEADLSPMLHRFMGTPASLEVRRMGLRVLFELSSDNTLHAQLLQSALREVLELGLLLKEDFQCQHIAIKTLANVCCTRDADLIHAVRDLKLLNHLGECTCAYKCVCDCKCASEGTFEICIVMSPPCVQVQAHLRYVYCYVIVISPPCSPTDNDLIISPL